MTLEKIIETIKTIKNGTFTVLNYQSETVKGGNNYLKITSMVVRIGVEYKNTKFAINKDTSGELKGKVWYLYKYILEGKTDYLLRVYPSNNPHHRAKSKYYCNGKEITKEEYNNALNKKPSSNAIPCFDVKIKNVISLG